jgi:hypothetical protein
MVRQCLSIAVNPPKTQTHGWTLVQAKGPSASATVLDTGENGSGDTRGEARIALDDHDACSVGIVVEAAGG